MFIIIIAGIDVLNAWQVDQILPHPCPPQLHERYVKDARDYVRLAEAKNGPIQGGQYSTLNNTITNKIKDYYVVRKMK